MKSEYESLTAQQTRVFLLLLAEAAGPAVGVNDRRKYESHRARPKVDAMVERWSRAGGASTSAPPAIAAEVDASVGHLFPEGSLQRRLDAMIDLSTPAEDDEELIGWLSGDCDAVPNQAGLVLEIAREELAGRKITPVKQLVSYTRALYSLVGAADEFDDLLRHVLEELRASADVQATRASLRARADAALRDKQC